MSNDSGQTGEIIIHVRWTVSSAGPALSKDALTRLVPYVTRYAQTLGVPVHAGGGTDDHFHLLFDLPFSKSLDSITGELRKAGARFLRDVLDLRGFAWNNEGTFAESVGRTDKDTFREYIVENSARHASGDTVAEWEGGEVDSEEEGDDLPDWLRNAMPGKS